jgi:hypothetical protein
MTDFEKVNGRRNISPRPIDEETAADWLCVDKDSILNPVCHGEVTIVS